MVIHGNQSIHSRSALDLKTNNFTNRQEEQPKSNFDNVAIQTLT